MTKLIIVRHCQALGNLERFFQGRIDSDITQTGRAQIGAVAELLSAEPIDIMYTSTLKRARLTAEGINVYHEVPLLIDERLSEINAGLWEGMLITEIEKNYPDEFHNWREEPAVFRAPEGESMSEVYDRMKAAVDDIIKANDGKTVCIVSHGCAIKCLMCYLHGWTVENVGNIPIGTNTSVNVVKADGINPPEIIMETYTDHLASVR